MARISKDVKVELSKKIPVSNGNVNARNSAIQLLSRKPDARCTGLFIECLQDKSPRIRRAAAEGLGRIKDPIAVTPLLVALAQETEQTGQRALIEAVGKLGDISAIEPLQKLAKQKIAPLEKVLTKSLTRLTKIAQRQ